MTEHELGTVIARREFDCGAIKITLEIGAPYPVDDGGTWFCPLRITGLDSSRVRRVGGVDSMQALVLALASAAADLYTCDAAREKILKWLDQDDLGLPKPKFLDDLLAENDPS